jgi:hypothetical protein
MFLKTRLAFAALFLCLFSTAILAESVHPRLATGATVPNTVIFDYSADTGDLHVYQDDAAEFEITALEIKSESNVFLYDKCPYAPVDCHLFDVYRADKLFRLDQGGYGEVLFPKALPVGLSHAFLANDLNVDGAIFLGGTFSDVVMLVPEPSPMALLTVGLLSVAVRRRRD